MPVDLGMEGPQEPAIADTAAAAARDLEWGVAKGGLQIVVELGLVRLLVADGERRWDYVPEPDVRGEVLAPEGGVSFAKPFAWKTLDQSVMGIIELEGSFEKSQRSPEERLLPAGNLLEGVRWISSWTYH